MSAIMASCRLQLSEKISGVHLERMAMVYVRQSTLQQLERHQESTRLQYGLVERAWALGWTRNHIEVIDEDLGKSGTTTEGRAGFQRLVIEPASTNLKVSRLSPLGKRASLIASSFKFVIEPAAMFLKH